tara:strand:- start:45 stop:659 length:615 start_codon:yes stop_codon:yes gene_type:complete
MVLQNIVGKSVSKKLGRPKRRRGPKPKPKPEVKAKKPVARKKKEKVVRTKAEQSELNKLIRQQKKDEVADTKDPLPRRRATGPEGVKPVEQGPLLSKVQLPEKMSKAQARRLIMQGKAKVVTDKNGKKKLISTGEYAPDRRIIAEEMGLGGKGKLPTEAELDAMGGFEIKRHGGKVKRNMGGPVRGVGVARQGFGKAKYSDKMY